MVRKRPCNYMIHIYLHDLYKDIYEVCECYTDACFEAVQGSGEPKAERGIVASKRGVKEARR